MHTLTNVQYITTTVHYIDKDWNMQAHILATRPAVDKHTADYIRNFVVDVLLEFGLQKEGNIFMTDNAANIKHTAKRTRQTVHVDRLLLCKRPPPAVADADSGVPPDTQTTTDGPDNPDAESQPLLGLDQDSQSWGDTEYQSQSQSASGSGRPTRVRRRPTALESYILE